MKIMKCRFCKAKLDIQFADLGTSPPSNDYLSLNDLNSYEKYFPLKVYFCSSCKLVQTEDFSSADELFREDYAYFSSVSKTLLEHSKLYVDMIVKRLGLDKSSFVVEIAANDGYLLQNFQNFDIPCIGIEPTEGTASVAEKLGLKMLKSFFGLELANLLSSEGKKADLIIGNNVYAHVPDIQDFTAGIAALLKKEGVITLEFPHILNLIENLQFDTIYHEHYSYLSLMAVKNIFEKNDLKIFDVEEIETHGGSLRVYGCHVNSVKPVSTSVKTLIDKEISFGLESVSTYINFQNKIEKIKLDMLTFLIDSKNSGKKVAGFGAAAKSSTILNYIGARQDLLSFISDTSIHKQGKFLPGSRVPILGPEAIDVYKPDFIIIFPWNLRKEIINQMSHVRAWGCKFVVMLPKIEILS
jgi:hypothetical protein